MKRAALFLLAIVAFPRSLPAAAAAQKPSLVVVISVDQMRADYLERFRPWFGKDGFNRFLERGAVYRQARFRHAATFTGPGHASIGTGLDPRDHGIVANRWYDARRQTDVYCVEDRERQWVGAPAGAPKIPIQPASPIFLDAATLGDRLKEKFPGSRVVGISLKDRSAVLMAGRKADAVLWFEERFARFVTSTYYPPRPELLAFNERVAAFLADDGHRRWALSGRIPPGDLERVTFDPPELFGAKEPPKGYGATFPHELPNAKAIVSSPWGDVLVLDLARFVIERMRLGANAGRPDLLFIGLSSTDYYGHWFGPDSKEIAEGIVRLDDTLAAFFRWLDERVGRGRALVWLTADHGVQPIPQVAREKQKRRTGREDPSVAGRVDLNGGDPASTIRDGSAHRLRLELELGRRHGYAVKETAPNLTEGVVAFFEEPCLYLNRDVIARRGLSVEPVKEEVKEWVRGLPGVLAAYTNTEIGNGLPPDTPHALEVARSFRADRSGDVFVILKPGWMWSYGRDTGTTHGQPCDDDARVPLAAWGPGVAAGAWDAPVSPLSIARTVAALFGFEAGASDAQVLEPVLGAKPQPAKAAAAGP
ncbi:MAG: alkaline phosphatase family protein [Thermoanaerobaculia bacterium]